MSCCMYANFLATIANMGQFYSLPEAICCCLQTCNVLLVMYRMYIPALIVTSADISQLYGYINFMLLTNILPETICCCLHG